MTSGVSFFCFIWCCWFHLRPLCSLKQETAAIDLKSASDSNNLLSDLNWSPDFVQISPGGAACENVNICNCCSGHLSGTFPGSHPGKFPENVWATHLMRHPSPERSGNVPAIVNVPAAYCTYELYGNVWTLMSRHLLDSYSDRSSIKEAARDFKPIDFL